MWLTVDYYPCMGMVPFLQLFVCAFISSSEHVTSMILEMTGLNLTAVPQCNSFASATKILLDYNQIVTVPAFAFSGYSSLLILNLKFNQITSIDGLAFSGTQLRMWMGDG